MKIGLQIEKTLYITFQHLLTKTIRNDLSLFRLINGLNTLTFEPYTLYNFRRNGPTSGTRAS